MYLDYALSFEGLPSVTPEVLMAEKSAMNPVIVDVRGAEEWGVSRIPGAITIDDFESNNAQYRDRKIVVYCTIGARSGRVGMSLMKRGFDVSNLRGSLLAWTWASGDLVDAQGAATQRVHVYGRQWAITAPGYEAVW